MQHVPHYTLTYGTTEIRYAVIFSRRRTLAIQVAPDEQVTVRALVGSPLHDWPNWCNNEPAGSSQQQRFQGYAPPAMHPREYVSGESYRYLWPQYRFKVRDGAPEQVVLGRTELYVTARAKEPQRVGRVLEAWYRTESRRIFAERLSACWPREAHLNVPFPTLGIRRMQ